MGGRRRDHEVQRSETDAVVFLETRPAQEVRIDRMAVRRRGRRVRALLGGVSVVLVPILLAAALWSAQQTNDASRSGSEGAASDPAGTVGAGEAPAPAAGGGIDGDGDAGRNNRYFPVDAALDEVVVGAVFGNGDGQRLLTGAPERLEYVQYDARDFDQVSFDSSGRFLAAIYRNSFLQSILVVGRLDDDGETWVVEPAAVDINGFAWHPHRAGQVAFASASLTGGTQVSVVDLTRSRPFTSYYRAAFPGRLRAWGDWGFAFDEPGPTPLTSVARYPDDSSPTANNLLITLTTGAPGTALGLLDPTRLLIDGADVPIVLNLQNAVYEQNRWYAEDDEVFGLRSSPSGRFSVALLGERGAPPDAGGDVVLFSADPAAVEEPVLLFSTAGDTTFDWSADGRFVVAHQPAVIGEEGNRTTPASVTVYDLDQALFVGREIRMADGNSAADLRIDVLTLAFRETPAN